MLSFEGPLPAFCFVHASNGPRRGVGRDTLFAYQLREVLAPISKELLVDVQPPTELVLGLHDQMHVRVLLVDCFHESISPVPLPTRHRTFEKEC